LYSSGGEVDKDVKPAVIAAYCSWMEKDCRRLLLVWICWIEDMLIVRINPLKL